MVDAEASSPNLGGESREMLRVQQCPILPLVDSFSDVVTASRQRWKNVQILCYFFWAVLIFWLYTRKQTKTVLLPLC